MTKLQRIEFYLLSFFGGVFGQWSIGLARHMYFVLVRRGILH